jgi:putative spermidine/putrescine transport system ATP-binding protein
MLRVEDVTVRFGDKAALDGATLEVAQGEVVALLGPSGSGKTTLLRVVAGLQRPDTGRVLLAGEEATAIPPYRRGIGVVFQDHALFHHRDVWGNVAFGLRMRGAARREIERRVQELLDLVGLSGFERRSIATLSGGEQQRVALARALAIEPQVLLLDEPLSALDAKIRVALRKEIRTIQRQLGITTVYVTHDQEEALSLSDRVVVMNEGRIEQIGAPADIYNFPATSFVASFVGTLNLIAGRVVNAGAGRLSIDGQEIRSSKPVEDARDGATVTVAIRPESVELGDGGGANQLRGPVEDVSFLGSIVRTRIGLEGGASLSLDTFNDPHLVPPNVGEVVTASFPPEATLVIGAGPAPEIDIVDVGV